MNTNVFDKHWQHAKEEIHKKSEEIVEFGWEQHVILDHEKKLVYRYPRNQNASDKLADEVELLKFLHRQTWPVQIPLLREHYPDYSVYQLIEGDVLTENVIARISDVQMAEIGSALGIFLAQLHKVDRVVVERKKTKQTMTLLEYYSRRIRDATKSKTYVKALEDLVALEQKNFSLQVVVHGDLHGLNMVVDPDTFKLVGVIDFSEVEIGDPHQDFRKLFMADERLLKPAVSSYEIAGGAELDEETIRLWAYVNEWANVCYFDGQSENPTYKRAVKHLSKWSQFQQT